MLKENSVWIDYEIKKGKYCLVLTSHIQDFPPLSIKFLPTASPQKILKYSKEYLQYWEEEPPSFEREIHLEHFRQIVEYSERQIKTP